MRNVKIKDDPSKFRNEKIESFEVTKGEKSGDLLFSKRADQDLKMHFYWN